MASDDRGRDVRRLFDELVDLPVEERTRRIEETRSRDPGLAREVETLLASHDRADEVLYELEHPEATSGLRPIGSEDGLDRFIGRSVSHYRVLERLSLGGMGVVYRAEDERLRRPVALKFLPPFYSADPAAKRRFTREAQAASRLDHPNVGQVYEVAETDDGRLFIAMAFYDGESLRRKIDRGPLPVTEALGLAIQLAEGLDAVHRHGVVHRDIKPANVMVTEDGRVKILDFGVAKISDDTLTRTGRMMGTAAYMSPEQARADRVDARTDLWSLGVVLYEMITGRLPFRGDSPASMAHSILNDEPSAPRPLRSDIPVGLERVVFELLRKDPEARYPDAAALLSDLESLRDSREPPAATREWRRRRSRARWHQAWKVGGVAVACATAIWGVTTLTPNGPNAPAGAIRAGDTRPTIAVLPFDNLSGDPADVYFTDGLHEEILSRLARIGALKVISRTSVLTYRDRVVDLRTIAEELGSRYVLQGSVRRFEDRFVVTAQLVDATTEEHLWVERYERERRDPFSIQMEIAERVASVLRARLSREERMLLAARPTENGEAHDLYLRAMAAWSFTAPDSTIALLERAVELDPEFALAFVRLSGFHRILWFHNADSSPERLAMAKAAVDRALELDPDLPEAHLALGRYYYNGLRDYDRALAEFEIARRGLPNEPPLYIDLGYILRRQGRFEAAAASFRAALERDPFSVAAAFNLGATLGMLRDYEGAETVLRRILVVHPEDVEARVMLAVMIYCRGMGRPELARDLLEEAEVPPSVRVDFAWVEVLLAERRFNEAVELLEGRSWEAVRMQPWVWPRTLVLGRLHRWLGHGERAVAYFDSARVALETELQTHPEDNRLHAALGHALAGLGRREEAVRAARRATELMPISADALDGELRLGDLADVYANVGEPEKAIAILDYLRSKPGPGGAGSAGYLRRRPEWDPLRHHPGFARLLETNPDGGGGGP